MFGGLSPADVKQTLYRKSWKGVNRKPHNPIGLIAFSEQVFFLLLNILLIF